jgi:hypothetical protein
MGRYRSRTNSIPGESEGNVFFQPLGVTPLVLAVFAPDIKFVIGDALGLLAETPNTGHAHGFEFHNAYFYFPHLIASYRIDKIYKIDMIDSDVVYTSRNMGARPLFSCLNRQGYSGIIEGSLLGALTTLWQAKNKGFLN